MRSLFACLSVLGLLAPPAQAKTKLAVLGIEAVDEGDVASQEKTAAIAKSFTEALRARAALLASQGYTVPPNSNRELTEVKILQNCLDESVGCMTAVGKDLGVDKLLYGKLDKGKGSYALTVKLLNVTSKQVEKTRSTTISAADALNESVVKEKASAIFSDVTGTEVTAGTLMVKANVETGTVLVGGERKGELSGGSARITDLPEGSVLVVVQSDGHKSAEQQVTITSGREAEAEFTLEAEGGEVIGDGDGGDRQPASKKTWKIVGWTGLGVSAALFGFAGYAWWGVSQKLEKDVADYANSLPEAERTENDPCDYAANKKDCDRGEKYSKYSMYADIAGGIIGGAALGILIFKAYDVGGGTEESASSSSFRDRIVVIPTMGPDGAGISAAIRF